MAKLGEGDPRWLVEKREDGTNVNAWHWQEKDCLPWSRARLGELFSGLQLVSSAASVKATGVKSVEGDALLNVRKAKLIASYELAIKVSWSGTTPGGASGSGLLELPYVADENFDEDPEIKVVLPVEDAASQALKQAILASGKEPVFKAIRTWAQELRDGVPGKAPSSGHSEAQQAAPAAAAAASAAGSGAAAAPAAAGPAAATTNGAAKAAGARKKQCTVELTERFYARAEDIYECFTVQGRVAAFTRSPAVVEARPGGAFSWFSGHVSGTFEELEPAKRLVMRWRFNNWEDGVFSTADIRLDEPEPGNTLLTLKHTGLPAEDKFGHGDVQQQVETGWQTQIFRQIKAVFGFGV